MLRWTTRLLGATMIALLSGPACSAEAPAAIEAFARDLVSLQGAFSQQVFDANDQLREESRGQVALAVPRQFRWDYQQPFEQTIVADGSRIWVYDPDLEQVTVRPQAEGEASSPLMVLVDPKLLDARYTVEAQPNEGDVTWLLLRPRDGGGEGFEQARIGLRGGALIRIELRDQLGQRTVMSFTDWQRNATLRDGLFRFAPPPGADVVGDLDGAAEALPLQQ